MATKEKCPDCHVVPGVYHKSGCDLERCSKCRGQKISCGCKHKPGMSLVPYTFEPFIRNDLWLEFIERDGQGIPHCGLCGNKGIIDTTKAGESFTGAARGCGVRRFCICPNGRTLKDRSDTEVPR